MNVYNLILIFTIIIGAAICILTFKHRRQVGAKEMLFLTAATTLYSFGYLFEILSANLSTKIIWYNIEYLGLSVLPFLWLLFALKYSDYNWAINKKRILVFMVIPITTIIMAWTNKYHGLMIKIQGISSGGAVPEILKIDGPWYWVNVSYSYLLILIGSFILIGSVFNLPKFYIKQSLILTLGALLPIIGSFLYIFKLTPIRSFDFTPVTCTLAAVILTWSLFRLKVFQIIPIVRDRVFDNIEDGFIVIDTEGRVIDANKSCQKLMNFNIKSTIGTDIIKFFNDKNLIINSYNKENNNERVENKDSMNINEEKAVKNSDLSFFNEKFLLTKVLTKDELIKGSKNKVLIIDKDDSIDKEFFSVSASSILKNEEFLAGYLLTFHNVTESKLAEKKLYESRQKIEDINKIIYELNMVNDELDIYLKTSFAVRKILGFKTYSFSVFKSGILENKFNSFPKINKLFINNFFYNEFLLKYYEANKTVIINISENLGLKKLISQIITDISFILCVPIKSVGISLFFATSDDALSNENIKICKLLVENSVETLKRIWLQKSLKEQTEIDPLTGVYNRRYFDNYIEREVERSKKYNYPITIIMSDIDRFKELNDRYGHQVGDTILKGVGAILKGQTRKIDTVVRYGGDEFLIILPGANKENIDSFINRIKTDVLRWNEEVKLIDFNINLSMGVSSWNPEHDDSVEKSINTADMAMLTEKKEKKFKW